MIFSIFSRRYMQPNQSLQLTLDPSLALLSQGCVPRLSAAEPRR